MIVSSLKIEVQHSDTVLAAFAELQRRMADLTPVMAEIGLALKTRVQGRFETETDPEGAPWAGWADSTIKNYPVGQKIKRGKNKGRSRKPGNQKILDCYGDLRDSLAYRVGNNSVEIGFGKPYAVFHEFGTRKMPRRGLLFADPVAATLAPGDEATVLQILADWIDGATSA